MKLYKKIISVFLAGTLIFTGIHFSKINKKIETKAEPFGVPDFMSCHATDFFACR